MFLAGHTVAKVTYCVTKMIACSPMAGQVFDTMIVALSDRVLIVTHQNLSAGLYFEPP